MPASGPLERFTGFVANVDINSSGGSLDGTHFPAHLTKILKERAGLDTLTDSGPFSGNFLYSFSRERKVKNGVNVSICPAPRQRHQTGGLQPVRKEGR